MAAYRFLTDQMQADIVAEIAAAFPVPDEVVLQAEREHFARTVRAKMNGEDLPESFYPPDTAAIEVAIAVVVDEGAKLPVPTQKP